MNNTNGRPRAKITTDEVLNAYGEYRSVRAAARSLNITSGTAWARLKEAGVTPLGMTPSEAGKLGAKCRAIELSAAGLSSSSKIDNEKTKHEGYH